jgi:transposase
MGSNLLVFLLNELGLKLLDISIEKKRILLNASPDRSAASCPACEQKSHKVYSSYVRIMADLPLGTREVIILLHVRRFYCANITCQQVTFVERLPGLAIYYARRTIK